MKQKKNEGRFNGTAGAHDKSARPADGASANTTANTARQNGAAAKERSTKSKVGSILDITVDKMRALADTGLVVGDKIVVSDDITLIPVSRVSCGFASGGSDLPTEKSPAGISFGGAGGGGLTVTPVCFVCINKGNVSILNLASTMPMGAAERAITMAPELIKAIKDAFTK